MIELRGVCVDIGNRRLLDAVDARLEPGELVAVLGANGVGKTMLLRTIAGLHRASAGSITIAGDDVAGLTPVQRALRLALVVSDDVLLDALRVRDVVGIGRFPHHRWYQWRERPQDDAAVDAALAALNAQEFADRLFWTLSSGERQRVWIALGLAQETPVLLLDEPTSHLDARVAHDILRLLRLQAAAGKTIVCVLHDINDAAAYADRIALLGEGRLLALAPPQEILSSALLEQTFGVELERVRISDGALRVFAKM